MMTYNFVHRTPNFVHRTLNFVHRTLNFVHRAKGIFVHRTNSVNTSVNTFGEHDNDLSFKELYRVCSPSHQKVDIKEFNKKHNANSI